LQIEGEIIMVIRGFILLMSLSVSMLAYATELSVSPIKLKLFPKQKFTVLNVTNSSDKPVNVQVYVQTWSQDETGRPILQYTSDLIVFPKLLKIEGKTERPIRVGYRGKWPRIEQAYRIFVEELPVTDPRKDKALGVSVTVRFSVPAFVMYREETAPRYQFQIENVEKRESVLTIGVRNIGNSHFTVDNIVADLWDEKGAFLFSQSLSGWYVLPHKRNVFEMPLEQPVCLAAHTAKIRVTVKKQSQVGRFQLQGDGCRSQ
jgi:fimbrial chaperone protein